MKKVLFLCSVVTLLLSCENKFDKTMSFAGDNAAELLAVLDKYEAEGDGLKLAAAEFLIGNIRLHGLWAVFCFCAVANQPVLRPENVPQCSSNALFLRAFLLYKSLIHNAKALDFGREHRSEIYSRKFCGKVFPS